MVGKGRFTAVCMENNTVINDNTRMNSILRTVNYTPMMAYWREGDLGWEVN